MGSVSVDREQHKKNKNKKDKKMSDRRNHRKHPSRKADVRKKRRRYCSDDDTNDEYYNERKSKSSKSRKGASKIQDQKSVLVSSQHNNERHSRRHHSKKHAEKVNIDFDIGKLHGRQLQPDQELNCEVDYFHYHNHLRLYLYLSGNGVSFEDLTSEEAHKMFEKFCGLYNAGKLEEIYYRSSADLPDDLMRQVKRTNHKWKFNTSETERKALNHVKSGVKQQTEWDHQNRKNTDDGRDSTRFNATDVKVKKQDTSKISRKSRNDDDDVIVEKERLRNRLQRKTEAKRLKDRVKVSNEEMHGIGGKKYGRDRQIELKREQSFKQHAATRQRDEMVGGIEVSDADIYGESTDFKTALNREKKLKARLADKKAARLQELQHKEDEKRQNMLKTLGLANMQPGAKITIAPRNDP